MYLCARNREERNSFRLRAFFYRLTSIIINCEACPSLAPVEAPGLLMSRIGEELAGVCHRYYQNILFIRD